MLEIWSGVIRFDRDRYNYCSSVSELLHTHTPTSYMTLCIHSTGISVELIVDIEKNLTLEELSACVSSGFRSKSSLFCLLDRDRN